MSEKANGTHVGREYVFRKKHDCFEFTKRNSYKGSLYPLEMSEKGVEKFFVWTSKKKDSNMYLHYYVDGFKKLGL